MKIYRIAFGVDNGCNGMGVYYARNRGEAAVKLREATENHDPAAAGHIIEPEIEEIEIDRLNKDTLVRLLEAETSDLTSV